MKRNKNNVNPHEYEIFGERYCNIEKCHKSQIFQSLSLVMTRWDETVTSRLFINGDDATVPRIFDGVNINLY